MSLTKVTDSMIKGSLSGTTISSSVLASSLCTSIYVEVGNPIVIATGVVFTVDVPITAGIYQIFNCQGTGSVVFTKGSMRTAYTTWWGLKEAATDAVNAAALQASIDSLAPIVETPAGNFTYSGTGLIFNRAIRFDGAGGVGQASNTGADGATPATTQFIYSGTGIAMALIGTIGDSTENIHLSNFLLRGNALADGGICLGGTTGIEMVTKGSVKNVKVSFFTKATGNLGYGFRFRLALEFLFENCYANFNYIGYRSFVGDVATTILLNNCYSRENDTEGVNLQGLFSGGVFISFVSESNKGSGLYIDTISVTYCSFINWWSENNCLVTGTAPIVIGSFGGTTPTGLNFNGGSVNDNKSGVSVNLIGGNSIAFEGIVLAGSVTVGAGSVAKCSYDGIAISVTGNRIGALRVNGIWEEPLAANAITSMVLPTTSGIVYVNTKDNNQWYAIYGLFGGTGNVVEQLNPGSHFQLSMPADNAGTIGVYHNGAGSYLIKNATTGTLTVQLTY